MLRVTAGKGGADRYSILSPSLLALLRQYSQTYAPQRNPGRWLFANANGTTCVNIEAVQRAYQAARHCAGIVKHGGTHTCATALPPTCSKVAWTCTPSAASWATAHQHHQPLSAPHQPAVQTTQRRGPIGPAGGPAKT
ncbi:hypothetical protein [Candidatus Aalborgicola defluviihabitans]|uniref:hypothetical protein n=1 Tax=Candidatus Aalborgicola defluviihabitans TaxID=3386187 RepID=UPI0039B82772